MSNENFSSSENSELPANKKDENQSEIAEEEKDVDIKSEIKELINKYGIEKFEHGLEEYKNEKYAEEIEIDEPTTEEIEKAKKDEKFLITPEKLEPIIIGYQKGDMKAKEELLTLFEKYIPSVMQDYFGKVQPEDQEDLIQEGKIGLFKAAENCKMDKIDTFKAYARKYIWGYMITYYTENQMIDVKGGMKEKISALNDLENYSAIHNEKPTEHEVARQLEINVKELNSIKEARNLLGIISLDEPQFAQGRFGDLGDETNEPWLPIKEKLASGVEDEQPEEAAFKNYFLERIGKLMRKLSPNQMFVIEKRLGEEWSPDMVARNLGIMTSQARNIEVSALKKIRWQAMHDIRHFEAFLDRN